MTKISAPTVASTHAEIMKALTRVINADLVKRKIKFTTIKVGLKSGKYFVDFIVNEKITDSVLIFFNLEDLFKELEDMCVSYAGKTLVISHGFPL